MRRVSIRSSLGIGGRMAAAGGLVALVAAAAFAVLLSAIGDLRESARLSRETQQRLVAASRLETITLQLQSGQRGFLLTGDRAFLRAYEEAGRELADAMLALDSFGPEGADQRARVRALRASISAFYDTWSQPLIRLAGTDLAAARQRVLTGTGERAIARIRGLFDELAAAEEVLGASREAEAQADGRKAAVVAVVSLAALLVLLAAIVLYFVRVVVVPVRRIDAAAQRRTAGDLSVRVEPAGVGEARRLVENFNEMATVIESDLHELERRRAEIEAVLDAAAEGIAMTGLDGGLLFTNERMDVLWRELGVDRRGSIWGRIAALAALTGEAESYAATFDGIATDPEAVFEDEFRLPALRRSFKGYTAPVRGPRGVVIGRIFSLRETTRERAAEQAKEEFLATVSHELRTPLTSIIGYLELVREGEVGDLTSEQDRFLGIVDRSARHLHGLVDDLLVVGRTEEGRLDLDLSEVDLADIVVDCVEALRNSAEEKRLALGHEVDPGLVLQGDRGRLTQLVTNLVGNAIKFTPQGGRVDVRARAAGGRIVLEVADTGIGVPEAEQEKLFERFFRASSATGAQIPGTGLGLAISRGIAEAHGGRIGVESAEGKGTTFRVELPREGR
ncbi:MAG: ATP-binding protein [Gaiellaceae bacterium]